MQAVILAGGLGTRLWPLTKDTPKPMVPVAGAPYLEHQLRVIRKQHFTDVLLLTGYLGEQIEEYFGDGSRMDLRIRYSRETTPIGTGGALREAAPLLHDTFLLLYGDSYLPIDYAAVLQGMAGNPQAAGAVVVFHDLLGTTNVRPNIALGSGPTSWVSRYDKTSVNDPELQFIEAGVLAFRREVVDLIPTVYPASLEQQVFPKLIEKQQLLGIPTAERFYDIGTPERLKVIEALFA